MNRIYFRIVIFCTHAFFIAGCVFVRQAEAAEESQSEVKLTEKAVDQREETADNKFLMVDPENLPYPKDDRKNYGVGIGGGMGVVVAPHWVMTASHCITWKKQKANKVAATISSKGKPAVTRKADLVIRHKHKDAALVRIKEPFPEDLVCPPLFLKDVVKGKRVFVKKVSRNTMWKNIPATGKTDNWIVPKEHRKGKAGTSGSPWLVHSTEVGDVLVGITHGSGRSPQIGYLKNWIAETISENSGDKIYWATLEQTLKGQDKEATVFEERVKSKGKESDI